MIDPTNNEKQAMAAVLKPLGDFVAAIGLDKPLSLYQKHEVMQLIELVITQYQDKLREITSEDMPFDDIPF